MSDEQPAHDRDREREAEARWSETDAYQESARRTAKYGAAEWAAIHAENDAILEDMAALLREGASPEGEAARACVERHRLHIDRWFYATDHWMHARLAEMYAYDERFSATFEKVAPGLTAFLVAGIEANALHQAGNVEVESALASARAGRGLKAPPSEDSAFSESGDAVQEERSEVSSSSREQRKER